MSKRFAGKVAIVTGAASGIGAATARELAEEGARVVVVDIDHEQGARVAEEIGGRFEAVDVGDAAAVERLVRDVAASERTLDVLVSNAFFTAVGPIESL